MKYSDGNADQFKPQKIIIAENGARDGTTDGMRTGHLRLVVAFIQHLGFTPLAPDFVFDKSGFGEFMFHAAFPVSMQMVTDALKETFEFPETIEVTDDGIYDDGNAVLIGFSGLMQHPMLLEPEPLEKRPSWAEFLAELERDQLAEKALAKTIADAEMSQKSDQLFSDSLRVLPKLPLSLKPPALN